MGKILKINKRTSTFIWHTRVGSCTMIVEDAVYEELLSLILTDQNLVQIQYPTLRRGYGRAIGWNEK